jgi:3-methylfumaryl-CoA hydratase
MTEVDTDHLRSWIGKCDTASDQITPGLVERFRATLGDHLHEVPGSVPFGLHWCLAPVALPHEALGPDGHPARGGFLPPVPLRNRMWAGGTIRFLAPFAVGDLVRRESRIADVVAKQGRSGLLVFVQVEHAYHVGDRVMLEERHDIVYRDAPKTIVPAGQSTHPEAGEGGVFVGDPVTLFRYSALTFNGHRIHYDHPYATGEEGYAGLVVHGPLQATLLMQAAVRAMERPDFAFAYRGLAPLIAGQAVGLHRDDTRLWLEKRDGTQTFEARVSSL